MITHGRPDGNGEGAVMEGGACACGCGCGAPDVNGKDADRAGTVFMIGTGVAMLGYGGWTVARRAPRWFPLWLAALVTWFTLCKYLICTRCEYFGKRCDFYWLGAYAAKLFERQPERTLDAAGIAAEGGSVAVLQVLPAVASLGNWRSLLTFLVLLGVNQAAQLRFCCLRCVEVSTDPWKRDTCPTYRLAEKLSAARRP